MASDSWHDRDRLSVDGLLAEGLLAGLAGVAAMTLAEKLEQAVTGRPNSYVPAHTLERLLGLPRRPDRERLGLNWAMHWGQGIVLGPVRALMARRGMRGPMGSFLFLNLRLLNDQSLENATGVGAPPWTWPVEEQWVDLLHKGVYAFVAGAVADRLVRRGRHASGDLRRGMPGTASRARHAEAGSDLDRLPRRLAA
ncbi:hypothetical protein [Paracraurococcus lichenis]|uniref:DUF1440 domain-containing protein n=1 Tax=Paracraurococcus lichenis TaxID=3064888 RepID=A0ABT9DSB3_9PROT|nr:hypothetical protein [Paracraurococcus sp. LOR1-02]MDO9706777.1 hypothetical protein [Paracraurococcus sp. LOR1-02]